MSNPETAGSGQFLSESNSERAPERLTRLKSNPVLLQDQSLSPLESDSLV